jgi:hypothetical protein
MATFYTDAIIGSDITGDGSSANPWALPSYAASKVLTIGDIIYVRPGIYYESVPILLAPGVSLTGAGDTSEIISTYAGTEFGYGCLNCRSFTTVIDGNQTISYIKLDCTLSSSVGIYLGWRNNITISHITLTRAIKKGIWIGTYVGTEDWTITPHDYTSNFTIEYSNFDNNMNDIFIHGINTMNVHHNTFREVDRTYGDGVGGRGMWGMWWSDIKIQYNTFYKPANANVPTFTWNFCIEEWNGEGGNEISYNLFSGGGQFIDLAGIFNVKGTYDYSWWVHHNQFIVDMSIPHGVGNSNYGISVESTSEYMIFNHNRFVNLDVCLSLQCVNYSEANEKYIRNILYHHNLCENTGDAITGQGVGAVTFQCLTSENGLGYQMSVENIYILNNTFSGSGFLRRQMYFATDGIIRNVNIINNIIEHQNTWASPIYGWLAFLDWGGSISDFTIKNNNLFDNQNDNQIVNPENYTGSMVYEDNQIADSLLRVPYSDYHLTYNSAARGNGIDPSIDSELNSHFPSYILDQLLLDFDDEPISPANVDIGAYIYRGTLCKILSAFYNSASVLKETVLKTNLYSVKLVADSTTKTDGETGQYTGNDGRVYSTICIGSKEYLSENLKETEYRDHSAIAEVVNYSEWSILSTGAFTKAWYDDPGTGTGGTVYDFKHSLVEDSAGDVNLVNDLTSPGNSKYYGTDGSGTKGWFTLPAGGGTALTGSTNNTICTVTGADAIQGEANLTFDGSVLAVTGTQTVTSTITASNFLLSSDERLKQFITPINSENLDITYKRFELKSEPGQLRYGVVAQDIQSKYPELIRENTDGVLSVAYIDLLIREVAYLKKEVNTLKFQLDHK